VSSRDLLLKQGIAAARAGDKSTARALLTQAARQQPQSEAAWLWLSAVLETPQGRAHCLRQVLELNPSNWTAQQGLAALEQHQPAPAIVARPAPREEPPPSQPEARPWPVLFRQLRFWQGLVACLAVVALGLIAFLAYAVTAGGSGNDSQMAMAAVIAPTSRPLGTLRPTFTATPTPTPSPTDTSTPTPTTTPSHTPTPTSTPTTTPTVTATAAAALASTRRPRRRASTSTPTRTPAPPQPALSPRRWDSRLAALGVRLEPANVAPGQFYWRLVEARWADEAQSAGRHSIFIEALNAQGSRSVGQTVLVQWASGQVNLCVEDRPAPDWGANFGMYNTLGSYAVRVGGAPSDRVVGMGLGTATAPNFTVHTSFYLTFQLVCR
jgi:hypothetical protein